MPSSHIKYDCQKPYEEHGIDVYRDSNVLNRKYI